MPISICLLLPTKLRVVGGGLIQYNALNSHTEQMLVVILINILMLSTFPMFSESKYSKTQCSKAAFMVISSDTISIFC